jgi:hypothetical protein
MLKTCQIFSGKEIRQIDGAQSSSSRPGLGKEGFSRKILLVSGIIKYNFGLSAFIVPKSGVKM